jgi:hypothetical protein
MLGAGMNARKLATICALLATTPNLIEDQCLLRDLG